MVTIGRDCGSDLASFKKPKRIELSPTITAERDQCRSKTFSRAHPAVSETIVFGESASMSANPSRNTISFRRMHTERFYAGTCAIGSTFDVEKTNLCPDRSKDDGDSPVGCKDMWRLTLADVFVADRSGRASHPQRNFLFVCLEGHLQRLPPGARILLRSPQPTGAPNSRENRPSCLGYDSMPLATFGQPKLSAASLTH